MRNVLLAILFSFVTLIDGNLFNNHDFLMEQFRKYASNITAVEEKWITQPVDHFNTTDTRSWQMKYYQNKDTWRKGGPIIIMLGGEGVTDSAALAHSSGGKQGLLEQLAIATSGAIFITEHRYYGESKPLNGSSVSDLKYLSSSQALADAANLIQILKQQLGDSKVVVLGGSYAGNLAAWMRLRYPNLVDAAIASSAPVLAKFDFTEYFEHVGQDFEKYAKPDCLKQITDFFTKTKKQIKSPSGIAQIKKDNNICEESDLTKPENQAILFNSFIYVYGMTAQYGNIDDIRHVCDTSQKPSLQFCNPIDFDKLFNQNVYNPIRHWFYQTCTEFGYSMTAPASGPFADIPVHTDYYVKICTALFGPEYNQARVEAAVKHTNDVYGGLTPNVTNVIFVNGELDPWHKLSVLKDLLQTVPARMIPGASHCSDLLPSGDNQDIKKVQEEEIATIKKWIGLAV